MITINHLQLWQINNSDINISGNSGKTNYFVSINRFEQEGVIKGSGLLRNSIRANVDVKVNDKVVNALIDFFQNRETLNLVNDLIKMGVTIQDYEKIETDSILSGKRIVITGTLESMSRAEAKVRIESLGGKVVSSISKNTNYLITGEKPTNSKIDKANSLEVKIINENEMFKLLQ